MGQRTPGGVYQATRPIIDLRDNTGNRALQIAASSKSAATYVFETNKPETALAGLWRLKNSPVNQASARQVKNPNNNGEPSGMG